MVLDGGHVRLVARSLQYQKIVSMDLSLVIGPEGRLRVSLAGARIGRLPMPVSLVRSLVEGLRGKFVQRPDGVTTAPAIGELDSAQAALVLQRVISAIDGEPIATEMTWRIQTRKRVRVTRIDIDAGRLTLHMVPVLRPDENGRQVPINQDGSDRRVMSQSSPASVGSAARTSSNMAEAPGESRRTTSRSGRRSSVS